jgi:hypothetical protein
MTAAAGCFELLFARQITTQLQPLQLNSMLLLPLLQAQAVAVATARLKPTFRALPDSFDFIFVLPLLHYAAHKPYPLSKHHSGGPAPC